MNTRMQALTQVAPTPFFTPVPRGILQRKCACGNHTMAGGKCAECAKSKSGLQRKLAIGASNDPLEREADRVADQVLAAPAHSAVSGAPPRIQRYTGQATEGTDTAPASVDRVLASSGRPLEPALRQDMEQRFGHDFSRVRVHSDAAAEQSARDVNANAYTVGHNIVFGAGRFAPGTHEGRRLIAHELTHVVQQQIGMTSAAPSGKHEREADEATEAVAQLGSTVAIAEASRKGIARTPEDAPTALVPHVTPEIEQKLIIMLHDERIKLNAQSFKQAISHTAGAVAIIKRSGEVIYMSDISDDKLHAEEKLFPRVEKVVAPGDTSCGSCY